MMNKKLIKLELERERLIAEAESQRDQFKLIFDSLKTPIAIADLGFFAIKRVSKHPVLLIVSGAVLFKLFKSKSIWTLISRSLVVWKVFQKFQAKH